MRGRCRPAAGIRSVSRPRSRNRPGNQAHQPKRLTEVVDAGAVEVGDSIAVHIHAHLYHSDQLHQVYDSLPKAIAARDDRPG